MDAAKKLAAGIAKNAPIAVRACKKAINDGLDAVMDDAIVIEEKLFGSCFETEDQKAGMGNFLEKDKEKKLKVVPFNASIIISSCPISLRSLIVCNCALAQLILF